MNLDEEFERIFSDFEMKIRTEGLNGQDKVVVGNSFFDILNGFQGKPLSELNQSRLDYFLFQNYSNKDDFEYAIYYLEKTIDRLEYHNKLEVENRYVVELLSARYSDLGFLHSKNKNINDSFQAFRKSIMIAFGEIRQKIANDNYYYCYRKIDTFLLQNLSNRDITVASPSVFNDPVDCPFFPIMDARSDIFDTTAAKKAYGYFKVGCFVCNKNLSGRVKNENALPEYKNLLMWGHYANGHRGVCIKYKFNSKFLAPTQDCPTLILDVEYKDDFSLNNEKSKFRPQEFLATKNSCWSYENEVRLLHYDPNCNDNYKNLPLGDHGKVEAIYFGMKCTGRDINCIRGILGEEVAYYKMKQHNNDFFQLIAIPLNKRAEELLQEDEEQ